MLIKAIVTCLLITTVITARRPPEHDEKKRDNAHKDSSDWKKNCKKRFEDMTRDNLKAILSLYKNWTATNTDDQPFIDAAVSVTWEQHSEHLDRWKQFHHDKKAYEKSKENESGNIFESIGKNVKNMLNGFFGGKNSAKMQSDEDKQIKNNYHSLPEDENFDFQGKLTNKLWGKKEEDSKR